MLQNPILWGGVVRSLSFTQVFKDAAPVLRPHSHQGAQPGELLVVLLQVWGKGFWEPLFADL